MLGYEQKGRKHKHTDRSTAELQKYYSPKLVQNSHAESNLERLNTVWIHFLRLLQNRKQSSDTQHLISSLSLLHFNSLLEVTLNHIFCSLELYVIQYLRFVDRPQPLYNNSLYKYCLCRQITDPPHHSKIVSPVQNEEGAILLTFLLRLQDFFVS